jgi:ribonuclease Z
MHGDHVFGLPGLLLNVQGAVAQKPYGPKLIEVFGPVGLYNFIASNLSLTCCRIKDVVIEVYELHGGSQRWGHPGWSGYYPEFNNRNLIRKVIPQNQDGTWTLCKALEVESTDMLLNGKERTKLRGRGVHVTAAELEHVPKLHCFGFAVEEPRTLPSKIDRGRAVDLGLSCSEKFWAVKYGFPVMNDDGTREIKPQDVLSFTPTPRKLVLLGDCCRVPPPMTELCLNADVLVHEATFSEKENTGSRVESGHSSAADAARFAKLVNASVLALNHLTGGVRDGRFLGQEAEKYTNGKTIVQVTADLMEILVPPSGFRDFFRRETSSRAESMN